MRSTNSYLQPVQELSTLGRDEEKRRMSSSKRLSTSRPDGEKASQVVGSHLYSARRSITSWALKME
jgi:hypothetical protein